MRLEEEKIASIEPYSNALGIAPAQLEDLSHCTILPALVDSHVHLYMSATTDATTRKRQLVAGYEELRPVIAQHLHYLFHLVFWEHGTGGTTGDTPCDLSLSLTCTRN